MRPASAVATRADAPEPRSFGPYALAAAAIKGFSLRHPSRANTVWGVLTGPDHGAGDRREEDLRPAVAATLPAAGALRPTSARTCCDQAAVVPTACRRTPHAGKARSACATLPPARRLRLASATVACVACTGTADPQGTDHAVPESTRNHRLARLPAFMRSACSDGGGRPAPPRPGAHACGGRRPWPPVAARRPRTRYAFVKTAVERVTTPPKSDPPSWNPTIAPLSGTAGRIRTGLLRAETVGRSSPIDFR